MQSKQGLHEVQPRACFSPPTPAEQPNLAPPRTARAVMTTRQKEIWVEIMATAKAAPPVAESTESIRLLLRSIHPPIYPSFH